MVGSRNLGIENENSDYDYVQLDLDKGGTFREIHNEFISKGVHCYHYNKEYRNKSAKFEVEDIDDFQFIYNAEDFRAGVIQDNPFDYKKQWIEKLKAMDFYHRIFYAPHTKVFSKRFYHIVFNLECLKQNTLYPTMERVKAFHDKKVHNQDYLGIIEEIKQLEI